MVSASFQLYYITKVSEMQLFYEKNQKKFPLGVDKWKKICYTKSILKETQRGGESMNINDLKAEIARNDLTIPKLALLIGMDKKTLYSRINGDTSFKQEEIVKLSQVLNLSEDSILHIFFADVVS
jgi:hypothetical protein